MTILIVFQTFLSLQRLQRDGWECALGVSRNPSRRAKPQVTFLVVELDGSLEVEGLDQTRFVKDSRVAHAGHLDTVGLHTNT